ncbi:MAG: 3-deoxy-manno-octulosonate cytidylyltransferase [Acidobacteria bacterium]|nr:MAG: 3-deoxy-manno-octulosonate cytidylyltransferase [Acidobacteriota bacterium]
MIPARYASIRLPGKPLAVIAGKPLIWHVVERARSARSLDRVLVATDDTRIRDAVEEFGGEAVMTSPDHTSGTDRVAEVARNLEAEIIVNIQGDELMLDGASLDRLVQALEDDDSIGMATLRLPAGESEMADPNVVKVVCDSGGRALYFSRAAIPHRFRGAEAPRWSHVGVYAFRRRSLLEFAALPPSALEQEEGLEQLRALENGWTVQVLDAQGEFLEVNTPGDLERARQVLESARG